MKKALFIIPAAALLLSPLALIGHGSTSIGASAAEATQTNIYIPFNEDNFDVISDPNSSYTENSAEKWITRRRETFWNYRFFNALDDFYNGSIREAWTGTVKSKTWHQDQRYITFTFGAARNKEACKVEIVDANTEEVKATVVNNLFSDPKISSNMMMRVVDLGDRFNGDIYLKITDNATSDYGFVALGALRVNQTIEEAAASVGVHRMNLANVNLPGYEIKLPENKIDTTTNSNTVSTAYCEEIYDTNKEYSFVKDNLPNNFNEGFEVDQELANWAYDLAFSSQQVTTGNADEGTLVTTENRFYIDFKNSVSSQKTFAVNEMIPAPFNVTGDKFFAGGLTDGCASPGAEDAKYRLISSPFKMNDLGLFSLKLGGRTAKVELISYPDGEELYSHQNQLFADNVNNIVRRDTYNATMVRHIFEVPSAAGKNVCIALSDCDYGWNWGNAFFDEIKTDYADYPSLKLDLISQGNENGVVKDSYHLEKGAKSTALSEAAAFVTDYYAKARTYENGFSYCGVSSSLNDLVTAYTALSQEARAIVDLSDDYSYGTYEVGETIYQNQVQPTKIGASMANLSQRVKAASEGGVFKINEDNAVDYALLLALAGIAAASIVALVVLYKRKRQVK